MIRKLERREMVAYEPYHGVLLTDRGRTVAQRVLRIRRLWGGFLTGALGMAADDADALACKLEHVTPVPVGDLLEGFLGDAGGVPRVAPVPHADAAADRATALNAPVGVAVVVVAVDQRWAGFLGRHGIEAGTEIRVLGRGRRGVVVAGAETLDLAAEVAAGVEVRLPDGG
jgi:DtxR family Mn-dependent transcriptional regulator